MFNNYQCAKYLLIAVAIALALLIGYTVYENHKQPPIAEVKQITVAELDAALDKIDIDVPAKEVVEKIHEAEQKPPQEVFYTNTQVESDVKAKQIAKEDGAAGVIKKTDENDGKITNNYYGIHTEKKYKIKAGVTAGAYTSLNAGVQINKTEVIYHYSVNKTKAGNSVTVMQTLAEW